MLLSHWEDRLWAYPKKKRLLLGLRACKERVQQERTEMSAMRYRPIAVQLASSMPDDHWVRHIERVERLTKRIQKLETEIDLFESLFFRLEPEQQEILRVYYFEGDKQETRQQRDSRLRHWARNHHRQYSGLWEMRKNALQILFLLHEGNKTLDKGI